MGASRLSAVELLLFGGGMATGRLSGEMMGSGSMGGISWMSAPTLLVAVPDVVLFLIIFGKM